MITSEAIPAESPAVPRREAAARPTLEKVTRALATNSRRAHRVVAALLAVVALELAGAIAWARCPPLNSMVWDVATLLDGGYRVMLGQRPHVDFYSPLGLLNLAAIACGMKVGGPASAIAYVQAAMLPLLVLWAWALLRSRTSAVLGGFLALWVGVLAVAPRSIGFPPPLLTYSMQYNRWGWALLSIGCMELFLPRRDGKATVAGGLATGAIAGLLLFLKVNYFAAIALAIAVRLVLFGFQRKWLAGAAASFFAVFLAGFGYLHFDLAAFIGDLRLLGATQNYSARLVSIVQLTAANLPDLWFLAGAAIIAVLYLHPCAAWRAALRLLAPPAALAAIGIITCSANYQVLEIPLIYLALFVVLEQLRRALPSAAAGGRMAFAAVALMTAGVIGKPFYEDIATLAAAGGSVEKPNQADWPLLNAAPLRDVHIEPPPLDLTTAGVLGGLRTGAVTWREEPGEAYPYVLWFNDGVELLRAHTSPRSRVLVMDLSNPFSVALGLTPPRGDSLFWHFGRVFDTAHYPPASRVFGDVTDVMIPKAPIHLRATLALQRIYAPVLARDFQRTAESDLWVLYERRGPAR